jgi:type I restriction enzyme S subunit
MTKAKQVPAIRFKGYDDEWKETTLKKIVNIIGGGTPSTDIPEYWNGNIDWYSPTEIGKSVYVCGSVKKISILGLKNCSAKIFPANKTILFTSRASIGDMAILRKQGATNQGFQSLIVKNDNDIYFIYTMGHLIKKYSLTNASGSTFLEVSGKVLEKMPVKIPYSKEQSKIGTFFSSLDLLITKHQQKHDKLTTLKKAMLEKMFPQNGTLIPEIRFKGFTEEWEEKELGDIGNTYTGLSCKTKDDFGHGNAKFITYMNVFSNSITKQDLTEFVEIDERQNEVKFGDVFFTTSSETPEEVGMSSVWLGKSNDIYLNSFCFGFRPTIKIDNYFLAYTLRSSAIRKQIVFLAQGISRYNISKNKVMIISVKIPSPDEQQKIGQYFSNLDNLISLEQKQIDKLKNIKKACLEKMFV